MQVFSNYSLCLKVLSAVLFCAQCVAADNSSVSPENEDVANAAGTPAASTTASTETTTLSANYNTNVTGLPSTVVSSETPSTLDVSTTVSSNVPESTTTVTGEFHTTATSNAPNMTTDFRSSESTISTTPRISSTTEDISSTTQNDPGNTTEPSTTMKPYKCPVAFNLTHVEFKTEVNITIWEMSNDTICPTQIDIVCEALEENNTLAWPWVIHSGNATFVLNTNPFNGVVKNLSEFTNYTCIMKNNYSSDVTLFFINTQPDVPSSPIELKVDLISPTSFNISWLEPDKIPSLLKGYIITVIRKGVATDGHIWNNCSDNDTYIMGDITKNNVLFEDALADFVYDVEAQAVSNVGDSAAANVTSRTLPAAPGPPENVTFNPNETANNNNIVMTQLITWDIPCDTRGPVIDFIVELYGFYLHDNSREHFSTLNIEIVENQISYFHLFPDLWAETKYTVKIYLTGDINPVIYENVFDTKDNYASAPKFNSATINSRDITIFWNKPDNYPGTIINYSIYIEGHGISGEKTKYCNAKDAEYNTTENVPNPQFSTTRVVPNVNYFVAFSAKTSRFQGNWTNVTVTSNVTYPDSFPVFYTINRGSEAEDFKDNVTINFQPGCFNGEFAYYGVNYKGNRAGYEDHVDQIRIEKYNIEEFPFAILPQYTYVVNISVHNKQYGVTNFVNFTAPAGVPAINNSIISAIPIKSETSTASLTLKKKFFDESQGNLSFLAIIVSDKNVTGGQFYRWLDTSQWPTPEGKGGIYYQATPIFWNPFNEAETIEYILGSNTTCNDDQYCNKPLKPDKQYYVFLRLFNDDYYKNTMPVTIITQQISRIGMIAGIIAGLLVLSIQAFVVYTLWKKGYIKVNRSDSHGYRDSTEGSSDALLPDSADNQSSTNRKWRREPETPTTEIAKTKFISYCKHLEQNPEILKTLWNELEKDSKLIYDELPSQFAILPENRRKNRYVNILPYDHSRVKLHVDEDDELCSDYINASYIKGFSGENEYIATQGPLPGTCRDFWKMVLQEHVSIIIMVSRFIENNKDKCYKYFPKNRETMTIIGDDIEVRCSMELHFGFYCIRQLQVKKELKQVTVTHMQYLEWPDFGVPTGTEGMLNFCHQAKERWSSEGGMALIHCSAGVGRTGTIIATDILLRAVAAGRKIDVFNTVLDLRRHRRNMVQTEKQYMYIHQLIRSMIEFPIVPEQDNPDHVYENLNVRTKNGIIESAL